MSKEGTSQKEAATTSWPVEYPTALKNVRMTCSEDGKYITCTACSVYDSRKASKSDSNGGQVEDGKSVHTTYFMVKDLKTVAGVYIKLDI